MSNEPKHLTADESCPQCGDGTLVRTPDSRQPSPEAALEQPQTSWLVRCSHCGAVWRDTSAGTREREP